MPAADDDRVVDIDYCNNASALHHLEPLDDIVVREWGEDGQLRECTVLLGRFAKVAFTQKASDISLLRAKYEWLLANHEGGVGFYPVSEFVHVDIGRKRTWKGS